MGRLSRMCERSSWPSVKKVKITAGAVCIVHAHLCIELPPKYSGSSFMGYLKGKSALMIFDRHPEFKTRGDKEFFFS